MRKEELLLPILCCSGDGKTSKWIYSRGCS